MKDFLHITERKRLGFRLGFSVTRYALRRQAGSGAGLLRWLGWGVYLGVFFRVLSRGNAQNAVWEPDKKLSEEFLQFLGGLIPLKEKVRRGVKFTRLPRAQHVTDMGPRSLTSKLDNSFD